MNFLLVLIFRGSAGLAAFLFNLVLARTLGADGAGSFALIYSIVVLTVICARFGIDRSLLRLVAAHSSADEWSKVEAVYRTGGVLVIFLGIFVTAGLFLVAAPIAEFFSRPDIVSPLRWSSLAVVPVALVFLHAESLKGLRRVNLSILLNGVMVPLIAMCLLLLVDDLRELHGAVFAYLFAAYFTAVGGVWLWTHYAGRAWFNFGVESVSSRQLLSVSFPLFVVTLVLNFQSVIPVFFLGYFFEARDIALFNAAVKTGLIIGMILQAVNAYYSPRFAALYYKKEIKALEGIAQNAVLFSSLTAFPVLVALLVYPELIMALFGAEFVAAAPLLMVIAAAQFVNVLTGPVSHLFMMSDYGHAARDTALLGMIVTLLFCALLIPGYGAFGAAVAYAIGLVVKNMVAMYLVKHHLGIRIWGLM